MKYKVKFPLTRDMSPISYIIRPGMWETKEEQALWHYNGSRDHDGLLPLKRLPAGVVFEPIHES